MKAWNLWISFFSPDSQKQIVNQIHNHVDKIWELLEEE